MKEEIEKILDKSVEGTDYVDYFGHRRAIPELYKLFLTKQIELLEKIFKEIKVTGMGGMAISNALYKIQSELKQVEDGNNIH